MELFSKETTQLLTKIMDMNFRNILWYLVDTDDMEDLWYPTIYIGNAIRTKGKNIAE